ncbi:MAG: hypothetical protein ABIQ88_02790 [Chitinophagaceae bacterium]
MMHKNSCLQLLILQLYIAVSVLGGLHQVVQGQDLRQQFIAYNQQVMQEKLYAHTDKAFYLAGEICWFKLYNVDAFFNKPLGISKMAYAELLDKNNKPVLQAKIALEAGSGNGSMQLPVSLPSGRYLFRAYTRWMKNFDAAYFFEKQITVINPRKILTRDTLRQKSKYQVQFFPEGGNLVNGIQSRVAFRVLDQNGNGVACTGFIVNEKADTLVNYTTLKFGMGSFLFTPQQGHTYTAAIVTPDGSQQQSLPAAYSNGYVMQQAKGDNGQLKITVQASSGNTASAAVYLLAHTRGAVKSVQTSSLSNGTATFLIDTALLGSGISHFTVFNVNRQPVCERLFFKKPSRYLQIAALADGSVYDTRKKVTVQVSAADQQGKPAAADMSIAVYRIDSLAAVDETDISSYLWLSSDLGMNIESPGYYFTSQSPVVEEAMDNLLLTSGWRRFRWEDVLENKKPSFEFSPEFKGHIVKAKVISNANGQPVRGAESYLSVVGTRSQVRGAFSDDSGIVKFEMNHFYGNGELIVQTAGSDSFPAHVEIISPFADKYSGSVLPVFSLPEKNAGALFGQHVSVQVQNTFSGEKLRQLTVPIFDTTAFYAKPDKVYMLDDYVRFTTVEEILREYVPEVNVRKRAGKFYLPVFDNIRKEFFVVDPLVMLDGVPVQDVDKIMNYDPLKIRKLEVVARMYFYGNMFFGGIVNFVSYKGNLEGYELDPGATVIDYETLQMQREFFSPRYQAPEEANSRLPDFRSLLYWSPSLTINKDGRQDINFYTSDMPGLFAAVLQGITADGKTGSKTVFFQVKENSSTAGKK